MSDYQMQNLIRDLIREQQKTNKILERIEASLSNIDSNTAASLARN